MKTDTTVRPISYVWEVLRALLLALIITLVGVLIAAFAIKTFNIPTTAISIINQVIKGVSIFVSVLCCLKLPGARFIRGILIGLLYVALSFVVFSLFNGHFEFGISLLNDVTVGAVSGLISGIIASLIRK